MDELLLAVDGLQLEQGVLGQHMEVKWYCKTICQTYQQSAKLTNLISLIYILLHHSPKLKLEAYYFGKRCGYVF